MSAFFDENGGYFEQFGDNNDSPSINYDMKKKYIQGSEFIESLTENEIKDVAKRIMEIWWVLYKKENIILGPARIFVESWKTRKGNVGDWNIHDNGIPNGKTSDPNTYPHGLLNMEARSKLYEMIKKSLKELKERKEI